MQSASTPFFRCFWYEFITFWWCPKARSISDKLEAYCVKNPNVSLLIYEAEDYYLFGRGVKTTKETIDAALSDRSVILFDDHHTAWAISQALTEAGILNGKSSHQVAKSSFETELHLVN